MTVTSLKPPSAFDPNRKALAAAISLAAGAKRDARVADEAARQAAQNCWEAQSRLEKLREAAEPSGALADTFAASVAAVGYPPGRRSSSTTTPGAFSSKARAWLAVHDNQPVEHHRFAQDVAFGGLRT